MNDIYCIPHGQCGISLWGICRWIATLLLFIGMSLCYAHGPIPVLDTKVDVTTFPPIEDDIQALSFYSAQAKSAGSRLVERGEEILTQAHAALSDPSSPLPLKLQLITVLGEIGSVSSADFIVDVANDATTNVHLQEYALVSLPNFKPNSKVHSFVNQQLEDDKRHPIILRNALGYYVKQPAEEAKKWVEKYAAADASQEVRFAALYLGGALGMDSVKNDITDLLQGKQRNTREYYLLMGFAHVATMEEFNALVKDKKLNRDNVKKVREFLEFRLATAEEKKSLTPELLNSNNTQLKQAVVKHLIEEKDADVLATNWQQGDGVVRAAVKRAGFTISEDEHGASLNEIDKSYSPEQWQIILGFIVLAILLFFVWRFVFAKSHSRHYPNGEV